MNRKPSDYSSDLAVDEISKNIKKVLDKCGLYYRIFARRKSDDSTTKKLAAKPYCCETGYLMQDYIGVRIALYFHDDIIICKEIISKFFNVVGESITKHDSKTFSPVILNLVCKIPEDALSLIDPELWENYPFDQTFEIQIRTIFSEGWHEIDHDIRYKCKEDWEQHQDLDRNLNGILATLETCDWSIVALINDLAYREYKGKQWPEMLKNKLRIHLSDYNLGAHISQLLNNDNDLAKSIYRFDRQELLVYLSGLKTKLPLTANNMVYLINHLFIHNVEVEKVTPTALYSILGSTDFTSEHSPSTSNFTIL